MTADNDSFKNQPERCSVQSQFNQHANWRNVNLNIRSAHLGKRHVSNSAPQRQRHANNRIRAGSALNGKSGEKQKQKSPKERHHVDASGGHKATDKACTVGHEQTIPPSMIDTAVALQKVNVENEANTASSSGTGKPLAQEDSRDGKGECRGHNTGAQPTSSISGNANEAGNEQSTSSTSEHSSVSKLCMYSHSEVDPDQRASWHQTNGEHSKLKASRRNKQSGWDQEWPTTTKTNSATGDGQHKRTPLLKTKSNPPKPPSFNQKQNRQRQRTYQGAQEQSKAEFGFGNCASRSTDGFGFSGNNCTGRKAWRGKASRVPKPPSIPEPPSVAPPSGYGDKHTRTFPHISENVCKASEYVPNSNGDEQWRPQECRRDLCNTGASWLSPDNPLHANDSSPAYEQMQPHVDASYNGGYHAQHKHTNSERWVPLDGRDTREYMHYPNATGAGPQNLDHDPSQLPETGMQQPGNSYDMHIPNGYYRCYDGGSSSSYNCHPETRRQFRQHSYVAQTDSQWPIGYASSDPLLNSQCLHRVSVIDACHKVPGSSQPYPSAIRSQSVCPQLPGPSSPPYEQSVDNPVIWGDTHRVSIPNGPRINRSVSFSVARADSDGCVEAAVGLYKSHPGWAKQHQDGTYQSPRLTGSMDDLYANSNYLGSLPHTMVDGSLSTNQNYRPYTDSYKLAQSSRPACNRTGVFYADESGARQQGFVADSLRTTYWPADVHGYVPVRSKRLRDSSCQGDANGEDWYQDGSRQRCSDDCSTLNSGSNYTTAIELPVTHPCQFGIVGKDSAVVPALRGWNTLDAQDQKSLPYITSSDLSKEMYDDEKSTAASWSTRSLGGNTTTTATEGTCNHLFGAVHGDRRLYGFEVGTKGSLSMDEHDYSAQEEQPTSSLAYCQAYADRRRDVQKLQTKYGHSILNTCSGNSAPSEW